MALLKDYLLKLFVVLLLLSSKAFVKESVAQLPYFAGFNWTDSLVVIVDEPVVTADFLEFTIKMCRLNEVWNNNDTVLGNADLYFNFNHEALTDNPMLISVHENLSTTSAGLGNDQAMVQIGVRVWAGRLQIATTKRYEFPAGDPGHADKNTTPDLLEFPLRDTIEICKVRWELKTPQQAILGIEWDLPSTGLQTLGGNPIIETLSGDIILNPDPTIVLDTLPAITTVCEGEDALFGTHAVSTGGNVVYTWYDSLAGDAGGWHEIASGSTSQNITTSFGKNYHYNYTFNTTFDTLTIHQVPGTIDSIYIRCIASDPGLFDDNGDPVTKATSTRLMVRDSIWGFMGKQYAGNLELEHGSVITKCLTDDNVPISLYVLFKGLSVTEFKAEQDTIYFHYICEEPGGFLREDTIAVTNAAKYSTRYPDASGPYRLFIWEASLSTVGTYYVQNIWTNHCNSAAVYHDYDTIHVIEGDYMQLPTLTVAVGETIKTDTVGGVFEDGQLESVVNNELLGDFDFNYGDLDFTYKGVSEGTDTLYYYFKESENKCAYFRVIEVIDLKFLSIKVFLHGPFTETSGRMQPLLKNSNLYHSYFLDEVAGANNRPLPQDPSKGFFQSPYKDELLISKGKLRQLTAQVEDDGHYLVDWIFITLEDGSGYKEFQTSAFLREDGVVCDTAGNPYLSFKNLNDTEYKVIIEHRNHLAIKSKNLTTLVNTIPGTTILDFTQATVLTILASPAYASNPPIYIYNGKARMYPLDVDQNGFITISDVNLININSGIQGYMDTDINFDSYTTTMDKKDFSKFNGFVKGF